MEPTRITLLYFGFYMIAAWRLSKVLVLERYSEDLHSKLAVAFKELEDLPRRECVMHFRIAPDIHSQSETVLDIFRTGNQYGLGRNESDGTFTITISEERATDLLKDIPEKIREIFMRMAQTAVTPSHQVA